MSQVRLGPIIWEQVRQGRWGGMCRYMCERRERVRFVQGHLWGLQGPGEACMGIYVTYRARTPASTPLIP